MLIDDVYILVCDTNIPGTEADRKKTKNIKHSGNITKDQFLSVVRQMRGKSQAKEFKGTVKEVLGTCRAIGCTVDDTEPVDLQTAIDEDEFETPTE
jgi:large subunit ribosomal protein L12e